MAQTVEERRLIHNRSQARYLLAHPRERHPLVVRTVELFWEKVDKSGGPDACWPWLSHRSFGYGKTHIRRATKFAHRVAYELTNGSIPGGLELDHLCANKACVNPGHLEPVTHGENLRRAYARKPMRRLTACKNGHDASLFGLLKCGDRYCRPCSAAAQRRRASFA